ncbi:uncharacterized protein TRIADDRAFT_20536 [Trichoplax adhaerens]|uniref:RNase III domain-containing protein n=1 Tax=Trichoplax adhaerens TaxID=10228 RepID=B3RNU1_TRIAD|nr:hypothetical protein TRIADDRAFT_20536 [Trichoplax adhaerens]EDV28069.1 hypothetical protein TRIADDRAFT_20536 [Trichoplax adhaerens]|eukprot:XP_002109903.1 hypothetical protein TRIADDRAFT_20536 [Trichoplax adhaerens]
MFPDLSEGDLSVYRSALVNNKQLGRLGKKLKLDEFLAYSHEALKNNNLDRSIANGVEALFGAMYLENGLDRVREIFGKLTFDDDSELMGTWMNLVTHPLQEQFPDGDRILIPKSQFLQGLTDFEESIGVEFKHIRLLAKAFTHPSAGLNHLTIGDYQRLEFLGDAILSYMLASHVYRQFPHYREGHLSVR